MFSALFCALFCPGKSTKGGNFRYSLTNMRQKRFLKKNSSPKKKAKSLRGMIWQFFWRWKQSENNSEIKPPLEAH